MQAFGYSTETMQFMLLPLVNEKRDPGRLDGQRLGPGRAQRSAADALRLFQAALRPGDEPADRFDPRGSHHVAGVLRRARAEPAGDDPSSTPTACCLPHPILTNEELAAIKHMDHRGWKSKLIDITYARTEGEAGLVKRLDRICREAEQAIDEGYSLVVLSDRGVSAERVPVSSLLAVGAVHHHLIRQAKRTRIGIVLESGEAREVHHHCLLVGYGADAINPYMAFESLWQAQRDGLLPAEYSDEKIVHAYQKAVAKGMLKVMSKMGISTLQSYKGAQIFEAVGLNDDVIEKCFAGTASRIKGVRLLESWPRRPCGGTRSAFRSGPSSGWRCCRILASSTGGPKASGTCGTRSRSPICKSPPARTAPTPMRKFSKHANEDATRQVRPARPAEVQRRASTGRFRCPRSSRPRRSSSGSAPGR